VTGCPGGLVQADVRFVVIGGLALGSWGVIRGTKDCDIVPDPAPDNLDRLARLVAELGGHVQLGESLLGSERSVAALLRNGERALIATQLGDLDVVQGLDGVPAYGELRANAIDVEMAGVSVAVCALEHLLNRIVVVRLKVPHLVLHSSYADEEAPLHHHE